MKLLCIDPGASYATGDVFRGYRDALLEMGHDLGSINLSTRIDQSGKYLNWLWRNAGKPAGEKPSAADVLYLAGHDAVHRALRHEPDWTVIFSGMYFHPDLFVELRRAGCRTALVLTESPYDDREQAKIAPYVDLLFTNERLSIPKLLPINPDTHYLPHAYDPAQHHAGADDEDLPSHDVVFVGSGFEERVELLSAIDWTGIDLGLYGYWKELGSRSKLRQYVRGGITDNLQAAALYRRAKIGLNLYRSSMGFGKGVPRIHQAESLNPRAYELAACGVFQISDHRAEVPEVFGDAVPTFSDPEQLGLLIREYLADDDRRTRAAERARQAVLPHTYASRADRLVGHLERLLLAA